MAAARKKSSGEAMDEGSEGPLRLCALTRTLHDPDALVRFVVSPAGELVPDLARRLPGRGVWVLADRTSIARAVRDKVFARSLKRPVAVEEGLERTVEALLVRRTLDTLSLANKAGQVLPGFMTVSEAIAAGSASTLIHASDAAPGGREKLDRPFLAAAAAAGRKPSTVVELTIEEMSLAMGRPNVVHAALTKGGAAEKFLAEARRLFRYRHGLTGCAPAGTVADDHEDRAGDRAPADGRAHTRTKKV